MFVRDFQSGEELQLLSWIGRTHNALFLHNACVCVSECVCASLSCGPSRCVLLLVWFSPLPQSHLAWLNEAQLSISLSLSSLYFTPVPNFLGKTLHFPPVALILSPFHLRSQASNEKRAANEGKASFSFALRGKVVYLKRTNTTNYLLQPHFLSSSCILISSSF